MNDSECCKKYLKYKKKYVQIKDKYNKYKEKYIEVKKIIKVVQASIQEKNHVDEYWYESFPDWVNPRF
jgi:hypothetical protein